MHTPTNLKHTPPLPLRGETHTNREECERGGVGDQKGEMHLTNEEATGADEWKPPPHLQATK